MLLDKIVNDSDPRVRNAIEVLESRMENSYVPLLAERVRDPATTASANAIKALGKMKVQTAVGQLTGMSRHRSSEHRISALWALRQIGWWQLVGEVGRLAKEDDNMRVRRYALTILRGVAEIVQAQEGRPPTCIERRAKGELMSHLRKANWEGEPRLGRSLALPICAVIACAASTLRAAPTQEDVFRSIQDNVGESTDPRKVIAFLILAVAVVILLAVFSQWRGAGARPRR